MVEHATENRGVPSSILGLGTLGRKLLAKKRGRGSVVERLLAKEKVVGSNPIARSNDGGLQIDKLVNQQSSLCKWRRGQVVRQGSAKPSFTGSNPVDASVN